MPISYFQSIKDHLDDFLSYCNKTIFSFTALVSLKTHKIFKSKSLILVKRNQRNLSERKMESKIGVGWGGREGDGEGGKEGGRERE